MKKNIITSIILGVLALPLLGYGGYYITAPKNFSCEAASGKKLEDIEQVVCDYQKKWLASEISDVKYFTSFTIDLSVSYPWRRDLEIFIYESPDIKTLDFMTIDSNARNLAHLYKIFYLRIMIQSVQKIYF